MNNTQMQVQQWFEQYADGDGFVHGVNARTLSYVLGITLDQTKHSIRELIREQVIDRLTEPTDEDGAFVVIALAKEAELLESQY